ncbi:acyl-CoA thioesterase [Niabella ginsengisoli]|uniref:Acyl-CoA thioesterase n=1 Tax=Niabella ginsengisoli TaxID=522298 RepID=A0ABS9SQT0_9BACT|nr:thioesterase family protein [Niabella ginsengisoli]MCH5600758.1 acyl-CoA thioesterase [Niabella ginsengisoli]
MYSTDTKIRVRYAETDQMGVVYHSHYFQYFEVARAECIRDLGFTYADMERTGIIMPVVEVNCKYFRPALYDDLLTVKTILNQLPENHRILFHQEVYNEKNELLAAGNVLLYFMNAKTKQRAKMPDVLYQKIKPFFDEDNRT